LSRAGTAALYRRSKFGVGNRDPSIFQVGHLERVPFGTPYPGIVAHVGWLLTKLPAHPEPSSISRGSGARYSTCSFTPGSPRPASLSPVGRLKRATARPAPWGRAIPFCPG